MIIFFQNDLIKSTTEYLINWKLSFLILVPILLIIILFLVIPWKRLIKYINYKILSKKWKNTDLKDVSKEIKGALEYLKKINKGCTIIIQRVDKINELISDPIIIDAIISAELIANIFEGEKSPLHDGSLIIENGRIRFASAYINLLSSNPNIPPNYGTRHRSAIGLTEKVDAVAIILSEENGEITIAKFGDFKKVSILNLEQEINKLL